jgi:hypothetical protein
MFDLHKDIDRYKGVTPYASECYGIYQPMLGWQSKLTKKWVRQGGRIIDPRIKRILDERLTPGPKRIEHDHPLELIASPLEPGAGKSPYRVFLTNDLGSELLRLLLAKVQYFVDKNNGRLPTKAEWKTIVDFDDLMDSEKGDLRKVNDIHRSRLYESLLQEIKGSSDHR